MSNKNSLVGFAHIESHYGLKPVQPLTSTCRIGSSRTSVQRDGFRTEDFTPQYAPRDSLRGHFEFGLKYDDLNFEWLSRLFAQVGPGWIEEWLREEPMGGYARRTGFLYEWFIGDRLDVPDTPACTYDLVLDPQRVMALGRREERDRSRRWKLFDNMPGTPAFCPLVRYTEGLRSSLQYDLAAELAELDEKFGADLLLRSAAWLTFNESRATFVIEKESDRTDDIKRFAAALAARCGVMDEPLSEAGLKTLQTDVLGQRALRTGLRQSPVFVGSSAHHGATIVRYIAPNHELVPDLMDGLRAFEDRTRGLIADEPGASSVVRASALAFGFVYIHPMSDGNGRVHRLLINDALLRDGVVPRGVILPISSTITKSSTNLGDYQRVLDSFSAPLMRRYATDYKFGKERVCDDGVHTDFEFKAAADAAHAWRYPDLSRHCEYMSRIIYKTVAENMTNEASIFARHDTARSRLKSVFEMPDLDADAIIRSLRQNNARVSNKLLDRYPRVFSDDPIVAAQVIEAVSSGLEGREMEQILQDEDRGAESAAAALRQRGSG